MGQMLRPNPVPHCCRLLGLEGVIGYLQKYSGCTRPSRPGFQFSIDEEKWPGPCLPQGDSSPAPPTLLGSSLLFPTCHAQTLSLRLLFPLPRRLFPQPFTGLTSCHSGPSSTETPEAPEVSALTTPTLSHFALVTWFYLFS